MTKNIFNKNALRIQGKVVDAIKYLDGGFNVTLVVKVWETGGPVEHRLEIMRDCIGHVQVDAR